MRRFFEKIISILGYLFNSTGKSRGAWEKECGKLSPHGSETPKFSEAQLHCAENMLTVCSVSWSWTGAEQN